MNKKQKDSLIKRFIFEPQKYRLNEPEVVKKYNDVCFCKTFFGQEEVDETLIKELLVDSITNENESELDLLLMLLEHFDIVRDFDLIIAELLIQPWHHFHDRIAGVLGFFPREEITEYLYKGALYSCDNLEYESDYCGFNRKCLYALAKIGTKSSIDYIKKISLSSNLIIAKHATNILIEFGY
jgi:hypothetical protein